MHVMELLWIGPLAWLFLSSVCQWIRVRVFDLEYCSLPVFYYLQMNKSRSTSSLRSPLSNSKRRTTTQARQSKTSMWEHTFVYSGDLTSPECKSSIIQMPGSYYFLVKKISDKLSAILITIQITDYNSTVFRSSFEYPSTFDRLVLNSDLQCMGIF